MNCNWTADLKPRCAWLAILALVVAVAAVPAAGDELWVAPGEKNDHEVGDWGVTNTGEAHFVFGVPDDLAQLDGVVVVLLGKKNTDLTYDLALSIAQDGQAQDAFTASADGLPLTLFKDQITEVDVTGLFPAALAAGDDNVALSFSTQPNGQAHVAGLKVTYQRSNPLAGVACADDEVMRGYDDAGDPICVAENDILAPLDCPDGSVFVSFDEGSGQPVCVAVNDLLGVLDCPADQVFVGFDESTGEPLCVARQTLLAGVQCGSEQVLAGFDVDGLPICIAFSTILGGAGGGGGGGGDADQFGIDDVSVIEGDSGTVNAVFTVTLSAALGFASSVDFATADGSATVADDDYVANSGTLNFAAGETSKTITVVVNGDTDVEPTETFTVILSNAVGADLGKSVGVGEIVSDDLPDGR